MLVPSFVSVCSDSLRSVVGLAVLADGKASFTPDEVPKAQAQEREPKGWGGGISSIYGEVVEMEVLTLLDNRRAQSNIFR